MMVKDSSMKAGLVGRSSIRSEGKHIELEILATKSGRLVVTRRIRTHSADGDTSLLDERPKWFTTPRKAYDYLTAHGPDGAEAWKQACRYVPRLADTKDDECR